MADIFGYTKTVHGPTTVASPSAVMVKLDGGKVQIAQSVNITYARNVNQNYEIGSESVYLTAGHASGTCEISRLVGETKALVPFKPSSACDMTTIQVSNSGESCQKDIGVITMKGVLVNVGVNVTAEAFTVTDSASYQIGDLVIS